MTLRKIYFINSIEKISLIETFKGWQLVYITIVLEKWETDLKFIGT